MAFRMHGFPRDAATGAVPFTPACMHTPGMTGKTKTAYSASMAG